MASRTDPLAALKEPADQLPTELQQRGQPPPREQLLQRRKAFICHLRAGLLRRLPPKAVAGALAGPPHTQQPSRPAHAGRTARGVA
ncbi:hypothetical protein ABZ454_02750 [Streptomyces sp. NPDC005803]|uniref:hypothetical protein n=1 Tax=Streptomyces sp. NPDC005803 TaxID=3154297 RepID=UPI0033F9D70F